MFLFYESWCSLQAVLYGAVKKRTPAGMEATHFIEEFLHSPEGENKEAIATQLEEGTLVPDRVAVACFTEALEEHNIKAFVGDAFPCTVSQAHLLESALVAKGMQIDAVVAIVPGHAAI